MEAGKIATKAIVMLLFGNIFYQKIVGGGGGVEI